MRYHCERKYGEKDISQDGDDSKLDPRDGRLWKKEDPLEHGRGLLHR